MTALGDKPDVISTLFWSVFPSTTLRLVPLYLCMDFDMVP